MSDPFFLMYPDWALLPMVGLATAAVASLTRVLSSERTALLRSWRFS